MRVISLCDRERKKEAAMLMQLETLTADAALRGMRSPRARGSRERPEVRDADAMLAAARRILSTTRIAFADSERPARASVKAS
jgi:hypothetical protein